MDEQNVDLQEQEEQQEEGVIEFDQLLSDITYDVEEELEREEPEEKPEDEPEEEPKEEPSEASDEAPEAPIPLDDPKAYEVPKEFKTKDAALKWYAERYDALKEAAFAPEEFKEQVLGKYEQEVEGFKNAYLAMQKNPKEFFMQYLPEVLIENGISPVMDEEAMNQEIEKAIKFEFGADYKNQYNPADLIKPRSYSTRLLNRMNQVRADLEARNEQNKKIYAEWNEKIAKGESNIRQKAPSPEEARRAAEQQYERFKSYGFSEDQYKEFLDEAENHKLELEDLHKVLYFDGYMEQAYRQGAEDAQRKVSKSFMPAAKRGLPDSVSRLLEKEQQQKAPKKEPKERFEDYFKGLEFNIPNY